MTGRPDNVRRIERLVAAGRLLRAARRRHPGLFAWVYAIQTGEDGPIKIGVTDSPAERLATLQQGNAQTLRGIAAWRTLKVEEKHLHAEYDHARIRGEWFQPIPELVDYVLRAGGDFEDWER